MNIVNDILLYSADGYHFAGLLNSITNPITSHIEACVYGKCSAFSCFFDNMKQKYIYELPLATCQVDMLA